MWSGRGSNPNSPIFTEWVGSALNEFGYRSMNGLGDLPIKLIKGRGHVHFLKNFQPYMPLSNAIRCRFF